MKLVIAGSRDLFLTIEQLDKIIKVHYNSLEIDTVVSGTCSGVDKLGEKWAEINDKLVEKFPANWEEHGKSAGPLRNEQMAIIADCGLVIMNKEKSYGSLNMIKNLKKLNKKVCIVKI